MTESYAERYIEHRKKERAKEKARVKPNERIKGVHKAKMLLPDNYKVRRTPKFIAKKCRRFARYYFDTGFSKSRAYRLLKLDGLVSGQNEYVGADGIWRRPETKKELARILKKHGYSDAFTKEMLLMEIENVKEQSGTKPMAKLKALNLQAEITGHKKSEQTTNITFQHIDASQIQKELVTKRMGQLRTIEKKKEQLEAQVVNESS